MTEYMVDADKLNKDGAFPCPKCGTILNPDDESETAYADVMFDGDGGVCLTCLRCGSRIRLVSELAKMQNELAKKGVKMDRVSEAKL